MVKLAAKTVLLALILWGIAYVVRQPLPFYWGNSSFQRKYEYFKPRANEYNVLLFGSSVIYRHINPVLFDRRCPSSFPCHSFNFGVQAMSNPESHFMLEQLLADATVDLSSVKFILMDLGQLEDLTEENVKSVRAKYWVTPHMLQVSYSILPDQTGDRFSRLQNGWRYAKAHIGYQFNLGLYPSIADWHRNEKEELDSALFRKDLGRNLDGFLSLTHDYRFSWRAEEYLQERDDQRLVSIYNTSDFLDCEDDYRHPDTQKDHLAEEAMRLINLCKEQGIHLMFMVPPRIPTHRSYPAVHLLPKEHIMAMVDPREYPQFWEPDNLFDRGHFSLAGSREYTIALMKELRPLLDSLGQANFPEMEAARATE